MKMIRIVSISSALVGLVTFAGVAQAQGTLFVTDDKVGIGVDAPVELLHLQIPTGNELKMRLQQSDVNAWAYSVTNSNAARPNDFRISKQGTGAAELTLRDRNDADGLVTMKVNGSIEATNVVFTSSRDAKTDFQTVDTSDVLDRVAKLEMASWRYKEGSPGKHIGPIAEEFEETFNFGTNGKTISVVDANGIALAAIQGLYVEVQKRDETIESLAGQIADLQQQLDSLANR